MPVRGIQFALHSCNPSLINIYKRQKLNGFNMRFAVFAAVCLAMVVFATANDLNVGQRKDGDVHVASRRLMRPAVPGKPMTAQTGFNARGEITAVTAVNAAGSDATVTIVKGGPGQRNVVVTATSQPGKGLDVQVDIYATKPPGQTEASP